MGIEYVLLIRTAGEMPSYAPNPKMVVFGKSIFGPFANVSG